jgi:membrane protease YdiL (CAAX protease family)
MTNLPPAIPQPAPPLAHPVPHPPSAHPVPGRVPRLTHPVLGQVPRFTHPVLGRVPRWGSVTDPGSGGSALSTGPGPPAAPAAPAPAAGPTAPAPTPTAPAPTPTAAALGAPAGPGSTVLGAPTPAASALVGWVVVTGGIAFLLARPTLGATAVALPLLAVGYLTLWAAALAVAATGADREAGAPLGWRVPLGLGLAGVVGAVVVGGPVADRRVGVVAGGLALVAAVAEEALFRRVLYDRLLRFGVVGAVVGSAVVFALVHLPAYGVAAMPVDLGAALLFSWQRYASGRWTVPAVTHAVANLLAVT